MIGYALKTDKSQQYAFKQENALIDFVSNHWNVGTYRRHYNDESCLAKGDALYGRIVFL